MKFVILITIPITESAIFATTNSKIDFTFIWAESINKSVDNYTQRTDWQSYKGLPSVRIEDVIWLKTKFNKVTSYENPAIYIPKIY
ncbi:MAG: hypothetical protein GY786_21705 [Proteobacteria bacterium]|nr:hypothetical protein [Pseudomonadota bacterium]